jgi:hypothetical protein
MGKQMEYTARFVSEAPSLNAAWEEPCWQQAEKLEVASFRREGTNHRPQTSARLLYGARGLHGIFRVQDRYVRCLRMDYNDSVWRDSCVEFFVEPRANRGYFNFEFNCGGAFLCSHIINPERTPEGFKKWTRVPAKLGQSIAVHTSLPRRIEAEIQDPIVWTLSFFIPFGLFEHYLGPLGDPSGQVWRGNFFKCADESSHPHWASWAPIDEFNFHRPNCFGVIRFA